MLAINGASISLKLILVGQTFQMNLLSHVFGTKTALKDIHYCHTDVWVKYIQQIVNSHPIQNTSENTKLLPEIKQDRNGSERVLTILHGQMQLVESHSAKFILVLTLSCCLASGPI